MRLYTKNAVRAGYKISFQDQEKLIPRQLGSKFCCVKPCSQPEIVQDLKRPSRITQRATLTSIEKIWAVVLTTKCHPLEHSNLCRMLCWIKDFTLSWSHSIGKVRKFIHGVQRSNHLRKREHGDHYNWHARRVKLGMVMERAIASIINYQTHPWSLRSWVTHTGCSCLNHPEHLIFNKVLFQSWIYQPFRVFTVKGMNKQWSSLKWKLDLI